MNVFELKILFFRLAESLSILKYLYYEKQKIQSPIGKFYSYFHYLISIWGGVKKT